MSRLSGKVAIVTGGARGMGAATSRLFVEQGAKVVIGDLLEERGQALADELGDAATFVTMDVSQQSDWDKAIDAAEQFGPLNVLINNAGILHIGSIEDTTEEQFFRLVRVNQYGVFLGIQSVLEPMKRAGGGAIVNLSSKEGLQGKGNLMAYCSSKFAVTGMTKVAALEYGQHKIRVNSVHPGGVLTPIFGSEDLTEDMVNPGFANIPLQRVGLPEEVANMNLFLASDESSYSTGSEFVVDGGNLAGEMEL